LLVANFISDFWNDQLVANDRQWVFLVLAGLVVSFGFIRISTRLMRSPKVPWWPGSIVSEGGVHVHHLVFGIVLMMVAGTVSFAGFAVTPIYEICAFAFGVGIGLTIDEFALWLYLDDVYWAKQGRQSVDAVVIVVAFIALVLIGARPFSIDTDDTVTLIASIVGVVLFFVVIGISLVKKRLWHSVVGVFFFPIGVYAACRIGKPDSAWAKRFYGERRPAKQAKAEARFPPDRRTERFKERIRDAVGGSTEEVYTAKLERSD
jgi:hypothetical protein